VNWATVADPHTTTVFYMGGRTAPLIADRLIAEGLVALDTRRHHQRRLQESQRHWRGTLGTVQDGIAVIGYDRPVLIAVGGALAARDCGAGELSNREIKTLSVAS
jgi:uroporphyrin-III C-methyltransferase/precorrin-2 dehydrogenase/sirohydrochlorin ferrochelatase